MKGNTVLNLGVDMVESGTVCGTPSHTFDWDQLYIPLDKIDERPGFNPRHDYGEHDGTFAALVESIRDRGMLELPRLMPVVDKRGDWDPAECRFTIVAGHRRIAAAKALGWESVRACVPDADGRELAKYDEGQQLLDALLENLQRRDLNCIEVAEGIARLEKLGKTQEQIARWIGRDQGRVSKLVRLLELPVGVRSLLREGSLSASHGEELLPLLAECFLPGEIEELAHNAATLPLTKAGLRNVVQDKIKRGKPEQTTIPLEDYAPAHNSEPGEDKEPKPAPKDDNGLTRKDADASFAAAMAPDPDVVPLSSLPAPKDADVHPRIILGHWLSSTGLNWIEAAEKLRDIIEPNEKELGKPGMWFRLEPETAQKLMELCDWHLDEHGALPENAMQWALNDVVNSFHAAKLEVRAEAEKAKEALANPFPVFGEAELSPSLKDDAFLSAFWRCLANHGHEKKLLAFTLPTKRGTVRRFSDMLGVALGEGGAWSSPRTFGWVRGDHTGGDNPSVMLTYREEERSKGFAFKSASLLDMAEKAIAWRHAELGGIEPVEPASVFAVPTNGDIFGLDAPRGTSEGVDEFAGRLV